MTNQFTGEIQSLPLDIEKGAPVRLLSGQRVGSVGALSDRAFRLDADAESVWLSTDAVFTSDIGGITLVCEIDGLVHYRALTARR